jgi:hypothetical protein
VRALATELRVKRTMNGAEIDSCIEQAVAAKAATDERQRRCDWKRTEQSAASFADLTRERFRYRGVKRTWPNRAGMSRIDASRTLDHGHGCGMHGAI